MEKPKKHTLKNGYKKHEHWPTVTDGLDLYGLGDPLLRVGQHRLTAHLGFEQGVHQSGLPQAALPWTGKDTHTHTQLETLGTHSLVILDSHKGNLAKDKSLIQLNPKSFFFVPMTLLVM